jgi:hypothetical protein
MDDFLRYPGNQYNEGISLDEYNGVISLVLAQEGEDGTIYKRWCFPQVKGKKPGAKALPWRIALGKPQEAVKVLQYFIDAIRDGAGMPVPEDQDGDIPF